MRLACHVDLGVDGDQFGFVIAFACVYFWGGTDVFGMDGVG